MTTTQSEPANQAAAAPAPDDLAVDKWGWTRGHRLALAGLLVLLLFFLTLQYIRHPYRIDSPITLEHGASGVLVAAIDPNTADESTLARVPHVGEKLAKAIVSYRELHHDQRGIAFQNVQDMDPIAGIGKKTLEELRPYLQFPGDATQPARSQHGLIPAKPVDNSTEN